MQILSIRQAPPGSGNTLARFDVQLDGMRLYNLSLKQTGVGLRVFAPSAFGCAAVTFTHEINAALVALAMGELDRNGIDLKAA
ncbi:hypothetical protein [Shinella sp.]|uniref:hypothetical protein n=1 Tax=Shinella sp. TaxID=1870904 RepID=UPI00258BCC4B|nr:hypothetical protein [Shinella sp.]MCW5706096.1 hypothetical protein [Shinella sp.]